MGYLGAPGSRRFFRFWRHRKAAEAGRVSPCSAPGQSLSQSRGRRDRLARRQTSGAARSCGALRGNSNGAHLALLLQRERKGSRKRHGILGDMHARLGVLRWLHRRHGSRGDVAEASISAQSGSSRLVN
eukprot:scaffold262_cov230-Pinguiococcus_pyrenoidosus.AAC.8